MKHDITTCTKNHGVLEGHKIEDYVAGISSLIPYEVRNSSGDWTPYLPTFERQYFDAFDTMACVSFSFNNSVEIQHKFLYGEEINFSDRALAKMSGTTPKGNYLGTVAETARKEGLVLEKDWSSYENFETWSEFYIPVPETVPKKIYPIQYEWVDITRESLTKHLKQAPLQIIIPGHAVIQILQIGDIKRYFDTYQPPVKDWSAGISGALKILLNKEDMPTDLLRTFRIEGKPEVYAILNEKRYWVSPHNLYADGRGKLWADIGAEQVPEIKQGEAAKYPLAGLFGSASILDYVRFFFL